MESNIKQAIVGLNLENTSEQIEQGTITYALNAVVEGFDGRSVTYQNEEANELCIDFPEGERVIGAFFIKERSLTLYFVHNPEKDVNKVYTVDEDSCNLNLLLSDEFADCSLNFDLEHPIHKVVVKLTNCSCEIFFTDAKNNRRFINLDDLPWKEQVNPNNAFNPIKLVGELDCNKLNVQPNFSIPVVTPVEVTVGGMLKAGAYQYTVAYADPTGNVYTSYYNVTNPVSIFDKKITPNTDYVTTKAITVSISHLDTTGIYEYFNLAVVETINGVSTAKLLGTFPISAETFTYTHTGEESSLIELALEEIYQKFPYYDKAKDLTAADDRLIWADVEENKRINYQKIWNNVKVEWVSYMLPYNDFEGYSNGLNSALYKGFMRDEVYPLEGVFLLKNGKQTDRCHIPGRLPTPYDLDYITNDDSQQLVDDNCSDPVPRQRWQVYNTGKVLGYTDEYLQNYKKNCYFVEEEATISDVNIRLHATGNCFEWILEQPLPYDIHLQLAYINRFYWYDTKESHPSSWTLGPEGYVEDVEPFEGFFPFGYEIIPPGEYTTSLPGVFGYRFVQGWPGQPSYPYGVWDGVSEYKIPEGNKYPLRFRIPAGERVVTFCATHQGEFNLFTTNGTYAIDTHAGQLFGYHSGLTLPPPSSGPPPLFTPGIYVSRNGLKNPLTTWLPNSPSMAIPVYESDSYWYKVFLLCETPTVRISDFVITQGDPETRWGEEDDKFWYNRMPETVILDNSDRYEGQGLNYIEVCDECYKGPYQYGELAYWESEKRYPNNPDVWGDLAGQKIRHHKLPDVSVSPIHNNNPTSHNSFNYVVYPIGFRIDTASLITALQNSGLSQEEIEQIEGFKILRGNRKGHESVIAKGILFNVGKNFVDYQPIFYPNYPYNDLRPDPYYKRNYSIRSYLIPPGYEESKRINGFQDAARSRFTFFSPDTTFYQPSLSNDGQHLKLEAIMYGHSFGHFVQVKDNAMYKLLTRKQIGVAVAIGAFSGFVFGAGTYGWPHYHIGNIVPNTTQVMELIEKIAPYTNHGYMYTSVGFYSNMYPIPNGDNNVDGFKIRSIFYNRRVVSGKIRIEGNNTLVNYDRESSIYINTRESLKFPTEYSSDVYPDESRYNLASIEGGNTPETIRKTTINSYYSAIKRDRPSQWGDIDSFDVVDTGVYRKLRLQNNTYDTTPTDILGGDTYITRFAVKRKHPFFRYNTVGKPHGADIEYDKLGTIGSPMFWLSTKSASYDMQVDNELENALKILMNPGFTDVLVNLVTGGIAGFVKSFALMVKMAKEIYNRIGIKNVNLDNHNYKGLTEQGIMYLFSYGVPYFFCESAVNTDMRQATNEDEGNFFPNVGDFIPDDWFQETRVPIARDNTYNYNITYSKQNKENFYTRIPPYWKPEETCNQIFPNRVIWSEKSAMEDKRNNWLIYRPLSYKDLPKSFGSITAIDSLANNTVLVRFKNKSSLYNTLTTLDVNNNLKAYIGSDELFSTPPVDLSNTDLGSAGSQHKFLVKTPYGVIFTDAKRGHVILSTGTEVKNLALHNASAWFANHLPFKIEKVTGKPIDNHYNGIGLTGVYDERYHRLILTKRDYQPKSECIKYEDGYGFYVDCGNQGLCPEGYTYRDGKCVKYITTSPTSPPPYSLKRVSHHRWGDMGGVLFEPGYNINGIGNHTPLLSPFWYSKVNSIAVWAQTAVTNQWVGFEFCFEVTQPKTYYIGLASDNLHRFRLNGVPLMTLQSSTTNPFDTIIQYTNQFTGYSFESVIAGPYELFAIYPVSLPVGVHKITLEGMDLGHPGMLALEIYDNTKQQILAATSNADLNRLFSTEWQNTFQVYDYTCPAGFTLVPGDSPCDAPECRRLDEQEPNTTKLEGFPPEYFDDVSWTISYNFKTQSWVSFHSYLPDYYINYPTYFQSGKSLGKIVYRTTRTNPPRQYGIVIYNSSTWNHNTTRFKYQNYYGKAYPYILEYPFVYGIQDEYIKSISDYTSVRKYFDYDNFIEPKEVIYFNKSIIYNNQQNTGVMELIPRQPGNLSQYGQYPAYTASSKQILVQKSDNLYKYNQIWNSLKDINTPMFIYDNGRSYEKNINQANIDYTPGLYNKELIRAKEARVRHILDNRDDVRLVSKFIITETGKSIK